MLAGSPARRHDAPSMPSLLLYAATAFPAAAAPQRRRPPHGVPGGRSGVEDQRQLWESAAGRSNTHDDADDHLDRFAVVVLCFAEKSSLQGEGIPCNMSCRIMRRRSLVRVSTVPLPTAASSSRTCRRAQMAGGLLVVVVDGEVFEMGEERRCRMTSSSFLLRMVVEGEK